MIFSFDAKVRKPLLYIVILRITSQRCNGSSYYSYEPIGEVNRGLIINIASTMVKSGMPFETDHCANKFALADFSEALHAEVRSDEIDVSTIFPSAVETKIIESATNRIVFELSRFIAKSPAAQIAAIVQDAPSAAGIVDDAQPAG